MDDATKALGHPSDRPPARRSVAARPATSAAASEPHDILEELRPEKRLARSERHDVTRQVHSKQVHDWLRKHSRAVVPRKELPRKRLQLLMGCFQLLDEDGNGSVDENELGLAMDALGFSKRDTRLAFKRGDRNGDGKLDFEDFVQLFTIAWAHRETRDAFNDSFARDMDDIVGSLAAVPRGSPRVGGEGGGGGTAADADADGPSAAWRRTSKCTRRTPPRLRTAACRPRAAAAAARAAPTAPPAAAWWWATTAASA